MNNISVSVTTELKSRLLKIAKEKGCSFDEVINLALQEFVDATEDDFRTDLSAVCSAERSFFLSCGK